MVAIINGARIAPPRPDISIANQNPNAELTVVNRAEPLIEENKREPAPNKQIAVFIPDKLKKSFELARLRQLMVKQRKGDINEVTLRVKKKVEVFKQQQLKDSRFAGEVGKGSIFDVLV